MILRQFLHSDPATASDLLGCGRSGSGGPASMIGLNKSNNRTFGIDDEDTFATTMAKDIPPPPREAAQMRAANSEAQEPSQ